jgi:hypothetical protein
MPGDAVVIANTRGCADSSGEACSAVSCLVAFYVRLRRLSVPGRGDRGGGAPVSALWPVLSRRRGAARRNAGSRWTPWHHVEQFANNPIEADHGQLKRRMRPMRGLQTDRDYPGGDRRPRLRQEPAPRTLRTRRRRPPTAAGCRGVHRSRPSDLTPCSAGQACPQISQRTRAQPAALPTVQDEAASADVTRTDEHPDHRCDHRVYCRI